MLRIWGIEATQATQFFRSTHPLCAGSGPATVPCPDNSVPLVAGKPLVLRLYVGGATPGSGLGGVVSRPTSGGTYGSTFAVAGTGGTVATAGPAMRTDPSTTLQVVLKPQPAGTYVFDVVVLEYAPNWGSVVATATASITLSFAERRRIRIRLVRIHYKGRGMDVAAPSVRDFWDATELAQRLLPIPSPGFEIVRDSVADYDGDFTRIDPSAHDQMWSGYAANRGTTGNLLNILDILAAAESLPGDVVYVAIYPDGVNQAAFSGWAVGRWIISDRGPETFAHEILHKNGSPQHAPCGGPADVDPNYPNYPSFSALPAASIGEVGLDPVSLKAYDPLSTYDLMSYCGPKWISPYNYTRAFNSLPLLPTPPPAGAGPGDRFVDVHFARFPDEWVVLDLPGFARPRPPRPRLERAELDVVVRGRDGSVLSRGPAPVTRPLENADKEIPDLVEAEVPWFEDAAAVELVRGDETLAVLPVEAPPEIDVEVPKQRELEEGRGTLSYRVRAESARLAVAIRVTDDGGATWTGAVFREREGQVDVGPLLESCAGECRLEILATTGYHSSVERSPPFRVLPREREILAWVSASGDRVTAGEPVHLHAVALGGAASSDELLWYSDRDGELGRGARLPVTLRPGRHRIEVRTTLPFHGSPQLDLDVEPADGPVPGSADPRRA